MYPRNFFIPRSGLFNTIYPGYGNPFFRGIGGNGMGLFSKITSSIKNFNWKGLINGANKTLNVMNQAVPLIRESKPMINNVKSMIQLTKAFGNEVSNKQTKNVNNKQQRIKPNNIMIVSDNHNYNQPTFFA